MLMALTTVLIADLEDGHYEANDGRDGEFEVDSSIRVVDGTGETRLPVGLLTTSTDMVSISQRARDSQEPRHDVGLLLPSGTVVVYWWTDLSRRQTLVERTTFTHPGGPLIVDEPEEWPLAIFPIDGAPDTTYAAVLTIDIAQKIAEPFTSLANISPYYQGMDQYVFRSLEEPPPVGSHRGLEIAPGFTRGTLTPAQQEWYDRTWAAIDDGNNWDVTRARAAGNNTYELGRWINLMGSGLLHALRATGGEAFLSRLHLLLELMRDDLQDAWLSGETDGFDGWHWTQNDELPDFYGKDTHWDEALLYGWLAEATYALDVNRDVDPAYREAADFWKMHLKDHFEAKWIAREGSREAAWREGPLAKTFWHPRMSLARMAHFFWRLFDDPWYAGERDRILGDFGADASLVGGERYTWPHRVRNLGSDEGQQKLNYARYTWASLSALIAEGVISEEEGARYAATFDCALGLADPDRMSHRVDCSSSVALAPDSFGSAARFGSDGTTLDACLRGYQQDQSTSIRVAAFALYGVTE